MTTKIRPYQIVILILLVLLPAVFPYCSRVFFLIPYDTKSPTELIDLHIIVSNALSLPYWCFVGVLFSRWVKNFRRAFFLGNLPIFFNAVGEILYYAILGTKQNAYSLVEYSIGSHIDKFNLFSLFGIDALFLSILLSVACFLGAFAMGYHWEKEL